MSKKSRKRPLDDDDDDSSIEDFFDEQLYADEEQFDNLLDKKYDKDNENFDKRFRKKIRHKTEDQSTVEGVLDITTSKEIYKLQMQGFIDKIDGVVSTGKEANVYFATSKDLEKTYNKSELAIKIFRTRTLDFKKIKFYIDGDIRFSKSGRKSHQIIQTWALKEFKNLQRAFDQGIQVPRPVIVRRNILVMEFIGSDGRPAPQLRQCKTLSQDEVHSIYQQVINQIEKLWTKANLVHGDLSPYNMLYTDKKVYVIDMGQAVLTNHNFADAFLLRDIENILFYFSEYGIDLHTTEELFEKITKRIPDMELLKLKI